MANPYVPLSDQVFSALSIASTVSAANYILNKLTHLLKELKTKPGSNEVCTAVDNLISIAKEFITRIETIDMPGRDVWQGKIDTSDVEKIIQAVANKAAKSILGDVKQLVQTKFAFSDEGKMLRGYSFEGKEVSNAQANELDKIFNAWLIQHDYICIDSVIYESDKNGHAKANRQGNNISASPKNLNKLLNNRITGFETFSQDLLSKNMSNKSKTIDVEVDQVEFPANDNQEKPKQSTAAAVPTTEVIPESPKEVVDNPIIAPGSSA